MRHWLVLAALYALIAALIVPGPLGAQEEAPAGTTVPAETVPAEPPPAETVPAEPAPAPVEPTPAPAPAEPAPAPAQPAPAEPAPAPAEAAPAPAEEAPAATPAEPVAPTQKRRKRNKPAAVAAATENVTISDFQFTPAQITIQQGDTVTWTNEGPTAHSATASDGSFDTGIFSAGGSRSETFDEPGTFAYICTPHPNMHGTVVVEASSSGGSGSGDSGSGSGSSGSGSSDSGSTSSSGSSGSSSSGSGLPATGADALALAIIGVLMLALGFALQRRSNAAEGGVAGRIGW
jgi:LPXTG-motif cell wall-anchored protein